MNSPQQPTPPDPWQTSQAQQWMNVNTAIAQNELNNTNQITPYGTINYKQTGGFTNANGMGIPQFTATTTLSPEMQKLFNSNLANSQTSSGVEGNLLNNVGSTLSKPIDLSYGATENALNTLGRNTLDPQIAHDQAQLDQQLTNQGLTPGSEGWKYAETQFGLNKANQYNDLYLRGHNTAISDIMNQYNSPLNTLTALRSNSQVSQPGIGQLAPTAQSGIQPANYQQAAYQTFQDQQQQANAAAQSQNSVLGGLFGLGGDLIKGGFGLLSDRRDKKDIQKLGEKGGVDIYSYRYKGDPKTYPKVVGPMAQDVEEKIPGSTTEIGGHKVVKLGFGLGG